MYGELGQEIYLTPSSSEAMLDAQQLEQTLPDTP